MEHYEKLTESTIEELKAIVGEKNMSSRRRRPSKRIKRIKRQIPGSSMCRKLLQRQEVRKKWRPS